MRHRARTFSSDPHRSRTEGTPLNGGYTSSSPARLHLDIASAYLVTASRIVGWIIVSAMVYRRLGAGAFAMLTLVRSTVGLLGNTSLGLTPAMISELAKTRSQPLSIGGIPPKRLPTNGRINAIQSNGLALAAMLGLTGGIISLLYGWLFNTLHQVPPEFSASAMFVMAGSMGIGIVLRMMSDAPAAMLQTHDRIALDNVLVASAESLWVMLSVMALIAGQRLEAVGVAYLVANAALIAGRFRLSVKLAGRPRIGLVHPRVLKLLLSFGAMVAIAELSDFLYAPMDYILINRLLNPIDVATYAPALQIDGALLLLVTAVADVLLPKAAVAHHARQSKQVHRYYFYGTLASACLLLFASIGAWASAPLIFKFWLGKKLYGTRAILPLILIHTVISGSSAVGRSILLGMGKVKPFTIAVVIAAVSNVVLSYVFVHFFNLGLRGIIFGTIIAVVGRCGIWMPLYVLSHFRKSQNTGIAE